MKYREVLNLFNQRNIPHLLAQAAQLLAELPQARGGGAVLRSGTDRDRPAVEEQLASQLPCKTNNPKWVQWTFKIMLRKRTSRRNCNLNSKCDEGTLADKRGHIPTVKT